MEGRFFGRDILTKPACPFCGILIAPPGDIDNGSPHEMPVGRCSCGAVYVCDVIGHNLGTAMSEALVFSCDGDWDHAWDLLPEEDYQETLVENYDLETHLIVHGGVHEGRRIAGALFFIRLNNAVRETDGEDLKKPEMAPLIRKKISSGARGKRSFSKKEVEKLVEQYKTDTILELAEQDKRIIRDLQRLLYSVDKQKRWRASDILGQVCAIVVKKNPETVSKLMQGLFTSLSDTAASSWGSLDAIGEIISNLPDRFGRYVPQLYGFLKDRELLPEVLRALGNIAGVMPELMRKDSFHFFPLLEDHDHEIRGYAVILIGNLGASEAVDDLKRLKDDCEEMEVYKEGTVEKATLSRLAADALKKLSDLHSNP